MKSKKVKCSVCGEILDENDAIILEDGTIFCDYCAMDDFVNTYL